MKTKLLRKLRSEAHHVYCIKSRTTLPMAEKQMKKVISFILILAVFIIAYFVILQLANEFIKYLDL